jgi:hypothetical protein
MVTWIERGLRTYLTRNVSRSMRGDDCGRSGIGHMTHSNIARLLPLLGYSAYKL